MDNLSRYLRMVRIDSGYHSISRYHREKSLQISEPYYRALESGRASARQMTMEMAQKLCDALHSGADAPTYANETQFYVHLLKDMLPPQIFEGIVKVSPIKAFDDTSERIRLLEHDLELYREQIARARSAESFVPENKAVELFLQRPELLPVLHFIYLTTETSPKEIQEICDQNEIELDVEDLLRMLVENDVVLLERDETDQRVSVRRKLPVFRVPVNDRGRELKDTFLGQEVGKTVPLPRSATPFDHTGSFLESLIAAYTPDKCDALKKRVADFFAETAVGGDTLEGGATPFFVAVMVSPRPEYVPKTRMHSTPSRGPRSPRRSRLMTK